MGRRKEKFSRREALRLLSTVGVGAALAACGANTPVETSDPQAPVASKPGDQNPAVQPSFTQNAEGPTAQPAAPEKPATADQPSVTAPAQPSLGETYLAVARGGESVSDPAGIVEAAIKALGGMERFVHSGADVIIKPNICTSYHSYEYAATTNPVVIATLIKLALGAGAKRVRVMDSPFGGTAESAYKTSGIAEAVQQAGGEMELMNPNKFRKTKISEGQSIKEWEVYQEVLNCDLLINVPIAKHHNLTKLTLGGKNLLGVIQRRNQFHQDMSNRIPDLISLVRPGLTVVDAVRILMKNGPTGGNLNDVKFTNTIIASPDIVAADAYATSLFGLTAEDVAYVKNAAERGLGTKDLQSIKIEEIAV
jgi:uncharacterized protein (DUF362 family)